MNALSRPDGHLVRSATVSIIAVAAAALGLVAVAPAARATAGGDPPGTVTVTPDTPSTLRSLLEPLVGSATYLVYTRGDRLAARDYNTPPISDQSSEHLFARDKSGVTTDLGPTPTGFPTSPSIAGDILSGTSNSGLELNPPAQPNQQVYWWNLTSHTTGHVTLPVGEVWVSSSPDGFVYTDGTDLYDETTAGTITSLGHPFAFSNNFASGVADATGLVINGTQQKSGSTPLAYMRWSSPGTYSMLDTATQNAVTCSVVDATDAGCTSFTVDSDGDPVPASTDIIPLSGGAPTTAAASDYGSIALVGSTAVFRSDDGLESFSAADPTVQTGSPNLAPYGGPLMGASGSDAYGQLHTDLDAIVSAYGQAVMLGHALRNVAAATDANTASTLFPVPQSPVAAGGFSLTSTRLVYTDDEQVAASSGQFATMSSTLTPGTGSVSLSPPKLVKADSYYSEVGGSSSVTVYAEQHGLVTDLFVVGFGRTHVIAHFGKSHNQATGAPLRVSGHRVLYRLSPNIDAPWHLYNARTKTTRQIPIPESTQTYPALDGPHIVYVNHTGSITRENVVTGAKTHVATPIDVVNGGSLFIHGGYVGWSLTNGLTHHPRIANGYRNLAATSAPVRLSESLFGLNRFGAILASSDLLAPDTTYWGVTSGFSLRSYSGHTAALLPVQNYVQGPVIAGQTMAWIDGHGVLKVAPAP